jgi:hypothetical protein
MNKLSAVKLTPTKMAVLNEKNPTSVSLSSQNDNHKVHHNAVSSSGSLQTKIPDHVSPKTVSKTLIIGDSQVRHIKLSDVGGLSSKTWCFPGARIEQMSAFLPEIIKCDNDASRIVLCLGTNNVGMDTPEGLAVRMDLLLSQIKQALPLVKVSVVGLFPQHRQVPFRGITDMQHYLIQCNGHLLACCKANKCFFISLWNVLSETSNSFSPDGLHLSYLGKTFLVQAIQQHWQVANDGYGLYSYEGN